MPGLGAPVAEAVTTAGAAASCAAVAPTHSPRDDQGMFHEKDVPRFTSTRTLVMDESDQVAWIDAPIWPEAGSIIEFGPTGGRYGDTDAEVIEVRLVLNLENQMQAAQREAVIVVVVRPLGRTVTRRTIGQRASQAERARLSSSRGAGQQGGQR